MSRVTYSFTATVWLYPGETAQWHFVTLPKEVGQKVKAAASKAGRRGFGAVRVEVTIGTTTWQTSIFPDKSSGSYLLPLKAQVRRAEDIEAKDGVAVTFTMI